MKKFIKEHIHLSIFLGLLVLTILCGVWASFCKNYDIFGLYGSPRCKFDTHYFKNDTCSVCGGSITEVGELRANNTASKPVPFSTYFDSYDNYQELKFKVLIPSICILICFFGILVDFGHYIYEVISRRMYFGKKKKGESK